LSPKPAVFIVIFWQFSYVFGQIFAILTPRIVRKRQNLLKNGAKIAKKMERKWSANGQKYGFCCNKNEIFLKKKNVPG
jgi:hypothetical protein